LWNNQALSLYKRVTCKTMFSHGGHIGFHIKKTNTNYIEGHIRKNSLPQ
jgi:hypothetical protein